MSSYSILLMNVATEKKDLLEITGQPNFMEHCNLSPRSHSSLCYRSSASFAPSPSRIVPITASIGLRSFA